MKKLLVLIFCLVCLCSTSFAASWYWVDYSKDGTQFYIDNASVRKNYQYADVWLKTVNPDGSYSVGELILNHYKKTVALRSLINYDSEGNVIASNTVSYLEYESIAPDTINESIYYSIWRR